MCGTGKMQSPINLRDKNVVVTNKLGSLRSQYLPSNTTIKNRGHDIMVYPENIRTRTAALLDHHFG